VTHADNVAGWAHRRLAMHDGQLSERDDSVPESVSVKKGAHHTF